MFATAYVGRKRRGEAHDCFLHFLIKKEPRVPHISLVFREMWDTTTLDRPISDPVGKPKLTSVVSHISQKTSEGGTQALP